MVKFRAYKRDDLHYLREMLESQGYLRVSDISDKTLPRIGVIGFDEEKPVAAGFLRMVEGGFAQIDTLMSNGRFTSDIRHIAIGGIVDRLIQKAKNRNLSGILATSKDESTIKRAKALGFTELSDQTLIVLPLKEQP